VTSFETCRHVVEGSSASTDSVVEVLSACHEATSGDVTGWILVGVAAGAFLGYVGTRWYFDDAFPPSTPEDSNDYVHVDAETEVSSDD
jgi:hypothetical protein